MKMRLLFLGLLVLCTSVSSDERGDNVLRKLRDAGYIVVIDAAKKPVEIQIESEGKTIVCYSQEHKDSQYFTVRKEMFENGLSTLVKCMKGELSFDPGFI